MKLKVLFQLVIVCTIADGITMIRPGAEWILRGDTYAGLQWLDSVQAKPTAKEVDTAVTACQQKLATYTAARDQAKIDLNAKTRTDAERIDAIIKYLDLDK